MLGGRLLLRQPLRGHRVGHDAMLLAAATGGRAGEHAVDLGAGVGAAGLALAAASTGWASRWSISMRRCAIWRRAMRERNGLGGRVRVVTLDVADMAALCRGRARRRQAPTAC